jgi:octaprenyl-diphosphate synthase
LRDWIAGDLARIETELDVVLRGAPAVHRSAHHLLRLGGKRLRPMCIVLATRLGEGFSVKALDLAVAVELIHNATLLHDDVIDVGERRRGAPAARVIHGNAGSVLSGDWLLVQALKRVRRTARSEIYDRMLTTAEAMIEAEALQLANRGRLDITLTEYFRVIEGKTAALFRWALFSGAKVAGLLDRQCDLLEAYGARIGAAFQLVDDLLDFTGDASMTGKALFNDLREGRMTYPLLLALERDRSLRPFVERILSQPFGQPVAKPLMARIVDALVASGGARDCLALADKRIAEAIACLNAIPEGPGRTALVTLAEAILYRER